MNSFDYILLIPLLYGLYRGFTKGLIIELASLLALTLGIYGALHFSSFTFEFLSGYFEIKAVYLQWASYGFTFLIIVMLISFFDRFNKQFGMVNEEILSSSLMYNPILIQAEQFYPNISEEFERQKESIENLTDDRF